MNTVLIISCIAVGISLIAYLISRLFRNATKEEYKDWEIDDLLIVNPTAFAARNLKFNNGYTYAVLKGWNPKHIFIDVGNGHVHEVDWDVITLNKSAKWRRNFKECEEAMGKRPAFSQNLSHDKSTSDKIDGKPIELLTEIECQVYLTQAIADENYELAEKIKKRMENFR